MDNSVCTFSDIFVKYYAEYGDYVNKMRMIPYILDGLRLVERRILVSSYKEAKTSFKKAAFIVGSAIVLHPHGEANLAGTLAKLVRNGFLEGQGNWGCTVGLEDVEASAVRYVEAKMTDMFNDLGFKYIDYVDYDVLELVSEPLYLSAMLPLGLLFKELNSGVAFGVKTVIPSYSFIDLVSLLKSVYLNKKLPIIKPTYGRNICVSSDEDCLRLLTENGAHKIYFKVDKKIDKKNRSVILYDRPVGGSFKKLLKAFETEIANGVLSVIDKSKDTTELVIKINKGRKYDFDKMCEIIEQKTNSSVMYNIYVVSEDLQSIRNISVVDWVKIVFDNYVRCNKKQLENEIIKVDKEIEDNKYLQEIKKYLSECLSFKFVKMSDNYNYLYRKTGIDKRKIKEILDKHSIRKIMELNYDLDKLLQYRKKIIKQIDNVVSNNIKLMEVFCEKYK